MSAEFQRRHIGPSPSDMAKMLDQLNFNSTDELIAFTLPENIVSSHLEKIPEAQSEFEYLKHIKAISQQNQVLASYIGQGYYRAITPSVLLRNIFENPGWYTAYTPYQAEISQGRLEALLNFQTMVSDLTGLPIANASLLDEGTAAAEAMIMFYNLKNKRAKDAITTCLVDINVHNHVKDVLITRAEPLGIDLVFVEPSDMNMGDDVFGIILQYPNKYGEIVDPTGVCNAAKEAGIFICSIADIMSLCILKEPAYFGVDVVVGNTQRFGVPMGFGGPHAAYFACKEDFKRNLPGRIIGVSQDRLGNRALRMALQTREQHIRRERATSNICTAQALLAIMAGAYAVYHGPDGLKSIAEQIHGHAMSIASHAESLGAKLKNSSFFDTVTIECNDDEMSTLRINSINKGYNFYYHDACISISADERSTAEEIQDVKDILASVFKGTADDNINGIPAKMRRSSQFMEHSVFHSYRSETAMMRYLKELENKDLSLAHAMIPLGSCTMKLNAATQLIPVSWAEFGDIHPFVPMAQAAGYKQMIQELEDYLCTITGFTACSLQPNSGAQGEYAGLLTIRAYHQANNGDNRNIALIPSSAHGTNPASAVMAGMKVVVTKCDDQGNIDVDDLKAKAEKHKDNLACLMITYPSTHGVFEEEIIQICQIVHDFGGLVYMDGANMNAQVGLTSPGIIGADVCHLNLHKTFSIPHGGGGPGMGPICVNDTLKDFLPEHPEQDLNVKHGISAVSSAPWGSASILLISYAYIKMLGREGLKASTVAAILNANYIAARLEGAYDILYKGKNGCIAHELIVDLRAFKKAGVSAEDVAKRLIDYGFHAPTLSFPVAGTIMIEPTESEDLLEIDRFIDALLEIKKEIDEVARGDYPTDDNVLVNAPHTNLELTEDDWNHAYSREKAAYPQEYLKRKNKFWPAVARVDNAFGDRNLICVCPPIESYLELEER